MKNVRITISFLLLLIVVFALLLARCFYIQFFKSGHYRSISIKQQQRRDLELPQRGVIVDCRGRVLGASNKIQTIFAEPRVIKNTEAVSIRLAPIIRAGAREIYELIKGSKNPGFIKLKEGAEQEQYTAARKIYGVGVQSKWQRHYPMGPLASHVVGFTGNGNQGLDGIELQYEKQLSGSAGQNTLFVDAPPHRRPIRLKQIGTPLKDGVGIILTIDATIQQFARSELLKQYKDYEAESAMAIVAEPETGAILAMVSLPDFAPDNRTTADVNNFRNRAINDQFEPGSIIKPVVAAIAVDAGVIDKNEKIFCENGNYHGKGFGRIREYRDHAYGDMTIREILIKSSNIGMAKIGQKMGKQRLYKGLATFGFGKKTKIDIPGEVDGFLRPYEKWTGYSLTRIPFGHEITVTGIQLVRFFCILANGGRQVRPYLVKAIVDNNGDIIKLKKQPPPVGFVLKPEVARWMVTDCLAAVVNEGTGRRAKLDKWQVFGKTGTGNIALADSKGYSHDNYIASFIAGAPAEDPKAIVLVSIRKPNKKLGKGYTGGAVASPVAGKILEKTLNYLEKSPI